MYKYATLDQNKPYASRVMSVFTMRPWAAGWIPGKHTIGLTILIIPPERTGLVVRASDSGSGDPGSILGQVGVLFP